MTANHLTRRRFVAISAVLLGGLHRRAAASLVPVRWRGVALGASASIELHVPEPAAGRQLLDRCVAEVRRLEQIFSLYQENSAVSRLNLDGGLEAPPPELVTLASRALALGASTGGYLDVTVQPLWRYYAEHYGAGAKRSPDPRSVHAIARRVDYRRLRVEPRVLAFDAPGMAATFNGIAQGFVTDRVSALLRRAGLSHVLVDLGELRALGPHPSGRPWRVGIRKAARPDELQTTLRLTQGAVATSAGAGSTFGPAAGDHHLFDPRSGQSARAVASVTVRAPDATLADALSTAIACAPVGVARRLIAGYAGVSAIVVNPDGTITRV